MRRPAACRMSRALARCWTGVDIRTGTERPGGTAAEEQCGTRPHGGCSQQARSDTQLQLVPSPMTTQAPQRCGRRMRRQAAGCGAAHLESEAGMRQLRSQGVAVLLLQ